MSRRSKVRQEAEAILEEHMETGKGLLATVEEKGNTIVYKKPTTTEFMNNLMEALGTSRITNEALEEDGWEVFWTTMDGRVSYKKGGWFIAPVPKDKLDWILTKGEHESKENNMVSLKQTTDEK